MIFLTILAWVYLIVALVGMIGAMYLNGKPNGAAIFMTLSGLVFVLRFLFFGG